MSTFLNVEEGELVAGFFLIKERELKTASNGSDYANFLLERNLEHIRARLWDITAEQKEQLKRKSVVKIEGTMTSFRGHKQVNINRIRLAAPEDQVNVTELISKKGVQREELWQELKDVMEKIQSKTLRMLLKQLFSQRMIRERLTTIPATRKSHHTYYAGLLDHIVHISKCSLEMLPLYPIVNPDIVLTACLVHDLGKTQMFTEAVAPEYTTAGELMGHTALGLELIHTAARETGIENDDEELLSLKHCMVSGGNESVVLPKTAEAIFFHYIKEMNTRLSAFEILEENAQESWTYSPRFNRKMYTRQKGDT